MLHKFVTLLNCTEMDGTKNIKLLIHDRIFVQEIKFILIFGGGGEFAENFLLSYRITCHKIVTSSLRIVKDR
jgi:hypothetical protein